MAEPLEKDLMYLVMEYLEKNNFKEALHSLEQENGLFFNMSHFEEMILAGKWNEADKYLSAFTKLEDNQQSMLIYFEIRKHNYYEALKGNDLSKALDILRKDLKVFASYNPQLFKDMAELLTLENLRENQQFVAYTDSSRARRLLADGLKKLIENNPLLCNKLQFPKIRDSRLKTLLNQSLNWQHSLCTNPSQDPIIKTLYKDHLCIHSNESGHNQLQLTTPTPRAGPNFLSNAANEGDLPASPRTGFNKDGSLLAVSTNNNEIKILATVDGNDLLHTYENQPFGSPLILETAAQNDVVEITEPSQLRSLRLTTLPIIEKISRLLFSNSGSYILALASNGTHLLWKWHQDDPNQSIRATTKVAPVLMSQPESGNIMRNDLTNVKPENTVSCIALSKNDSFLMSASGGKITLFNMFSSKTIRRFMAPDLVAMCLAFYPQDNNVAVIGMNDSSLQIFDVRTYQANVKVGAHTKSITGLAFSNVHPILVSSGADSQIVTWNSEKWEMINRCNLNIPEGTAEQIGEKATQVQFHVDQIRLLVTHESQLSIYEVTKLECMKQWVAGDSSPPISQASFSSDCQQVYVLFLDGVIQIFGADDLQPQCRISPSAYLPATSTSRMVVPIVIAAHPKEANMLAVGLSDGGVVVLEPLETETTWGGGPSPAEPLPHPGVVKTLEPPLPGATFSRGRAA